MSDDAATDLVEPNTDSTIVDITPPTTPTKPTSEILSPAVGISASKIQDDSDSVVVTEPVPAVISNTIALEDDEDIDALIDEVNELSAESPSHAQPNDSKNLDDDFLDDENDW